MSGVVGSGVTTAARQLAGEEVAWCRLANGYDRATDLVAIAAASRGVEVEPAHRVFDLAEQLLDLLERDDCSLVVDDHHLGADPDIDRLLAETAALLPTGLRIVVASESRPAGLIGLVPARDLAVLDAGTLAFDLPETTALVEAAGGTAADAERWHRSTAGWPMALAGAERDPTAAVPPALDAMLEQLVSGTAPLGPVFDVAACLPYVTPEVLAATADASGADWREVVGSTALLVDHDDHAVMAAEAAAVWRRRLSDDRVAAIRRTAAPHVADSDPATAIELLLDAGEHGAAADVLGDHLSTIGVDRALTWLYRLPAELRRRFPPVLAAGQATVEVDVALADARDRVDRAATEEARREALLALGSVEAYRGELAAAATAFEAALRAAGDDAAFRERVTGELASTRFLLGDLTGARAAAESATDTPSMRWLLAQLAVLDGTVTPAGGGLAVGASAWDGAAAALLALRDGDLEVATAAAAGAYAAAAEEGGDVLAAAAPVHAWVALASGRPDDAAVIADELERRLGARHRLGRVHGALIRERVSRGAGARGRHERDVRRLRDLRATGYAAVEQLLDSVVPDAIGSAKPAGPELVIEILGAHRVDVHGRTVGRDGWKSKKALEVLTVLALAERGLSREQVVEEVWPGRDPDKGRTLLRTALRDIRKVLEPDRPAGEPSAFVEVREDLVVVDARTDLDLAEAESSTEPHRAVRRLLPGLAPEVASSEWGFELTGRAERALVSAATAVVGSSDVLSDAVSDAVSDEGADLVVAALEALIAAEPWQRSHYDRLAELHRSAGDEAAAAEIERRWFADDD